MYSVRYRYISTSSLLVCPSVSANPNSSCMQQFVETLSCHSMLTVSNKPSLDNRVRLTCWNVRCLSHCDVCGSYLHLSETTVDSHNRWCMETETRSTDAMPPRDKGQAVKEGQITILSVLNGTRPISIYKPPVTHRSEPTRGHTSQKVL